MGLCTCEAKAFLSDARQPEVDFLNFGQWFYSNVRANRLFMRHYIGIQIC